MTGVYASAGAGQGATLRCRRSCVNRRGQLVIGRRAPQHGRTIGTCGVSGSCSRRRARSRPATVRSGMAPRPATTPPQPATTPRRARQRHRCRDGDPDRRGHRCRTRCADLSQRLHDAHGRPADVTVQALRLRTGQHECDDVRPGAPALPDRGRLPRDPDDLAELDALDAISQNGSTPGYWVGISDAATEGTWLTVLGAAATYLPWKPAPNAQPNGGTADNCVVGAASELWDVNCGLTYPFTCECSL